MLIGRRFQDDGPEIILPGLDWQMPQGGIDADEDPRKAAFRELWEETGVVSAGYLGETGWLTYDFPPYDGRHCTGCRCFAASGKSGSRCASPARRRDRSADAAQRHAGGIRPWRWEQLDRVADLVVPFRREVYLTVAQGVRAILEMHRPCDDEISADGRWR